MRRRLTGVGLLLWMASWACAQNMDPATRALIEKMQSRIDGLEKRGYAVRMPHPDDRRTTLAAITTEGTETWQSGSTDPDMSTQRTS